MSNTKHTPTSWRVGVNQHGGAHVVSAAGVDSELICEMPGGGNCGMQLNDLGKECSLANAARIVKCVNAHDELVEALRTLRAEVADMESRAGWAGNGGRQMADAVLAKVQS